MNKLILAILKFYRTHISPNKPPCCRFTPTCSQYAQEAFEKYGFLKAAWLTLWRLLRCNPFGKSGYDPLP